MNGFGKWIASLAGVLFAVAIVAGVRVWGAQGVIVRDLDVAEEKIDKNAVRIDELEAREVTQAAAMRDVRAMFDTILKRLPED